MRITALKPSYLPGKRLVIAVMLMIACSNYVAAQQAGNWAEVGRLPIRYIDPLIYEASSENWSITQDKQGILYIGNSEGLLIHDGVSWELIEIAAGLGMVRSVAMGPDEHVYIGGHGSLGYLGSDSLGAPDFISLKEQLPDEYQNFQDVWNIQRIGDAVYFLTEKYLFRWHDSSFKVWTSDSNFDYLAHADDRVIVSEDHTLRYLTDADTLRSIPLIGDKITRLRRVTTDGFNQLFAIADEGLVRCQIDLTSTSACRVHATEIGELLRIGNPYLLHPLAEGILAIGFDGHGLALIDSEGKLLRHIDDSEGLENLEVMNIFPDRDGGLWLALYDGLARLEPDGASSSFSRPNGIPSKVSDILRWKGRLYAATMLGLYELVPGKGNTPATFKKLRNSDEYINCFDLHIVEDTLLAGCIRGLVRIDEEAGRISSAKRIYDTFITHIAVDPSQEATFFVAEDQYISKFRYENGKANLVHKEQIDSYLRAVSVEPRSPGQTYTRLWADGFSGNVYRIDIPDNDSSWHILTLVEEHNLPGELSGHFILNGTVHVATANGLHRLVQRADDTPRFEINPATRNQEVMFISKDPDEKAWVLLDDSLRVIDAQHNRSANPLPANSETLREFGSVFEEADGTVWIGHARGIARYRPASKGQTELVPTPLITKITTIAEDSLLYSAFASRPAQLNLPYETGSLRFTFAPRSYDNPDFFQYRVWLEGMDAMWQPWTNEQVKEFTRLREGSYTLHLQAKNPAGQQSGVTSFSFDIYPPWYRTGWAYALWIALSGMTLGGFVWGSIRFQTHFLRKRNETMAHLINKQTEEIRAQKASLEEAVESLGVAYEQVTVINDDLIKTNHSLEDRTDKLREALEANKEILGITAHDLKNPLNGIIGLAQMIIEDLEEGQQATYESAADNIPLLKAEAERMLQIIKDLLDKHREGEKTTLKIERVLLSDIVASVVRWNKKQAKDKEITLHYHATKSVILEIDVMAIQRVLDNYVSNAIKYSPAGSNVWITIERLLCPEGTPIVRVSVQDEGPGLTDEDKLKVFGKLQRLSAKPTAGEHSTGLGLYIVKQLIESHDGTFGVDSQYGEGATFWFMLPTVELEESDYPELIITEPAS